MTSISGISRITGSFAVQQSGPRPPLRPRDDKDPMAPVTRALGLPGDELRRRLETGQSLTEVAEQQGVSQEDLIAAIKAGKPKDAANGAAATASEQENDAAAQRIAARKATQGPPPGDPRGGAAGLSDPSKLQQLGTLLETDGESLRGSSATDVVRRLQDKGIDLSKLRSVLDSGDLVDYAA